MVGKPKNGEILRFNFILNIIKMNSVATQYMGTTANGIFF